jgi:hypothetical protein
MVGRRRGAHDWGMTNLTRTALIAFVVFAAFTIYSLWVVAGHGYTGFLALAAREPWGMQLLLDLVIACGFGVGWMRADAKRYGLPYWPFVPVVLTVGSIGLLAYVIVRGFAVRPGTPFQRAVS